MPKKVTKEDMQQAREYEVEYYKRKYLSPKAVLKPLGSLLKHKDPRIQLGAIREAKDIGGFKAPEKSEVDLRFPNAMALTVEARQEEKKKKRAK